MTKEIPKQYESREKGFLSVNRETYLARLEGGLAAINSNAFFTYLLREDISEEEYRNRLNDIFNAATTLIIYSEEYNNSTLNLSAEDTHHLSEQLELGLTSTEIADALEALPTSPTEVAGASMIATYSAPLVLALRKKIEQIALKKLAIIVLGTVMVSAKDNGFEAPEGAFSLDGEPSETAIAQEEQIEATIESMKKMILLLETISFKNRSSKGSNYTPPKSADVHDPCQSEPDSKECEDWKLTNKGLSKNGLAYQLKHLNKHLPNTPESEKLINKKGDAHVFNDKSTLSRLEEAIFKRGKYTGNIRGWERYGVMFDEPIGYRISSDGKKIPLHYGEMKIKDGFYHVIPRIGLGK